jgi:hypothetical protein
VQQQQQQQRSVARARVVAGDLNFASIPVCIMASSIHRLRVLPLLLRWFIAGVRSEK